MSRVTMRVKVTRVKNRKAQVMAAFEKLAGEAVKKTTEEAAEEARALAPEKTGDLKRSIDVAEVNSLEAAFGAQVEYAPFVEYGTRHMSPRSFITPAAINARKRLLKHLTKK